MNNKNLLATSNAESGFSTDAAENLSRVYNIFAENNDLKTRTVVSKSGAQYLILFIDEVVDRIALQRFLITPLILSGSSALDSCHTAAEIRYPNSPREAANFACMGAAILFAPDGNVEALGFRKDPKESGKESSPENIVLGPHERFGNSSRSNLALLRSRIRNPSLAAREFSVGSETMSTLLLCYVDGVTDKRVVEAAERKIFSCIGKNVKSTSEFLELFKEDSLSPFPQYITSERPDRVSSALLHGNIAIITEGSPWVILAPVSFSDFLKSPEDSHSPWIYASFIRLLRWISIVIAIITPAFYVAVMSFHPGLLPIKLMLSAANGRSSVPFPAIAEVVIMEIFVELLREASTSMPSNVSSTISLVGGIIIGETAISAGLASPLLVIIVAISAITSFTIPVYSMVISLRTVRFFSLLLASFFGFFGLVLSLIFIILHMVALKSLGREYLFPLSPMKPSRWKRDILKFPLRWIKEKRQ